MKYGGTTFKDVTNFFESSFGLIHKRVHAEQSL